MSLAPDVPSQSYLQSHLDLSSQYFSGDAQAWQPWSRIESALVLNGSESPGFQDYQRRLAQISVPHFPSARLRRLPSEPFLAVALPESGGGFARGGLEHAAEMVPVGESGALGDGAR